MTHIYVQGQPLVLSVWKLLHWHSSESIEEHSLKLKIVTFETELLPM